MYVTLWFKQNIEFYLFKKCSTNRRILMTVTGWMGITMFFPQDLKYSYHATGTVLRYTMIIYEIINIFLGKTSIDCFCSYL